MRPLIEAVSFTMFAIVAWGSMVCEKAQWPNMLLFAILSFSRVLFHQFLQFIQFSAFQKVAVRPPGRLVANSTYAAATGVLFEPPGTNGFHDEPLAPVIEINWMCVQ
jgi:hypothetical protein